MFVPAHDLIGECGRGWACAQLVLRNERTEMAMVGRCKLMMRRLHALMCAHDTHWRNPAMRSQLQHRYVELSVDLLALEAMLLRLLCGGAGKRDAALVACCKLSGSTLLQRMTRLMLDLLGPRARAAVDAPDDPLLPRVKPYSTDAFGQYLNHRKTTIYGGTNEIQKNILFATELDL